MTTDQTGKVRLLFCIVDAPDSMIVSGGVDSALTR